MKSAKLNMRGPTYRYNPVTCRYERASVSFLSIFTYALGLALVSAIIMVGLWMLHDTWIDTEKEALYKKENLALEKSKLYLAEQLTTVEAGLQDLGQKDKALHQKFFFTNENTSSARQKSDVSKDMLLADVSTFNNFIDNITKASTEIITSASSSNHEFANNISIDNNKLIELMYLPTAKPIQDMEANSIMSGFGMRINPFHKGMYKHTGIDIAVPRGTTIHVTASGQVIAAKESDLAAGYGNYIEIMHDNGFVTRYAHLDDIHVRAGQKVQKGFVIGLSGNSGGSVAPHLHYEILKNQKPVDPLMYMISDVDAVQYNALKSAGEKQNQSLD